jgi:pentatricopeptide repeat protein
VASYNSAIDACSKGGQLQKAIDLLREMQQQGLKANLISYNSTVDACSGSGEWQVAVELLREMQQQQLVPDIIMYNRVINACQNGGNWQLAVDLLVELKAASLKANDISYKCVIDTLYAANEHEKAEQLYVEMFRQGVTLSHWSKTDKGKLDFHDFTEGMTAAAMRIVLRAIVEQNTAAHSGTSNTESYVHPIANDLHIITGHAMHREDRDGSVLQLLILNMLQLLDIQCSVNARNKGMVTVMSSDLKQYAARVTVNRKH